MRGRSDRWPRLRQVASRGTSRWSLYVGLQRSERRPVSCLGVTVGEGARTWDVTELAGRKMPVRHSPRRGKAEELPRGSRTPKPRRTFESLASLEKGE